MNSQRIKHIVRTVIGLLLGIYFGCIALLNIPAVQHKISVLVTDELCRLLQTEVAIEKIDLGLPGRIIIQGVALKDREGEDLLRVARLSAKFDFTPCSTNRSASAASNCSG